MSTGFGCSYCQALEDDNTFLLSEIKRLEGLLKWYDVQCRRPGATPKGIAQELDVEYGLYETAGKLSKPSVEPKACEEEADAD